MSVQTTYTNTAARGVAGMIAEGPDQSRRIATGICTGAQEPGLVLTRTSGTDYGVEAPNAAADLALGVIAGVGVWTSGQIPTLVDDDTLWEDEDAMPVMERGFIYMVCETAMAKGDHPFVRVVAAGEEKLGALRNDADTSDAVVCASIIVEETVTVAGIVKCSIDIRRALSTAEFNALYPPGADGQVLTSDGTNWGSEV